MCEGPGSDRTLSWLSNVTVGVREADSQLVKAPSQRSPEGGGIKRPFYVLNLGSYLDTTEVFRCVHTVPGVSLGYKQRGGCTRTLH